MMEKAEISHIYEGFKALTLPKVEWTHQAHLITALCLLKDHGLAASEDTMPDMIPAYNVACGGVNSETEGYHHTITIFYLRVIDTFRRGCPDDNIEKQVGKLLASELAEPYFTLNFYSKDRLFTPEARLGYVAPDLQNY